MAQVEPAQKRSNTSENDKSQVNAAADAALDTEATNKLFTFLRSYEPAGNEFSTDMLAERYRIDLSNPLMQLDTKLCKAYAASDNIETDRQLYALICPKNRTFRSKAVTKLKSSSTPHMVQLVAAGIVSLSQPSEQRYVVIFDRPNGVKLSDYISKNPNQLTNEFICERIIVPLAATIHHMQSMDIAHGCINPDNIYLNQFAMLGPCVTEPCGYSQPFQYETLERMQSNPAGKGEGSSVQDYHALAVTVLFILFGQSPFERYPNAKTMARAILREGAYNALTQMRSMSEMFYDLFRGVFSHNPEDRWDYANLRSWLDGKRYHALSPPVPSEASRPFEFMGTEANTRRELTHLLAHDWDNINDILLNNKLSQWVAASLRNKELADSIIRIARTIGELGSKNEAQMNDQLTRVLMIMDPSGPIRVRQLAFHVDGLETLYADLYASKSQQDLQLLIHTVEYNTISEWIEVHRKKPDYSMPATINNAVLRQDRSRPYIRIAGLGFGPERLLYDLNPDLPCQSPLLSSAYICTLHDLLKNLDEQAPNLAKDQDPIDVHIAAFIASKIGLQHEINIRELSSIPSLGQNRTILALHLLSAAQARTELRLPGLTHWLALRIFPILEPIHSRTIRRDIKSQIMDKVATGHVQRLAQLVINGNFISTNQSGFNQAVAAYQLNEAKIHNYKRSTTVDQQREMLGYSMAKLCSYVGLMISIFVVLQS